MTCEEFSNQFDTLVSSYRRFKDFDNKEVDDSLEFDEYEKSIFLTQSQKQIIESLYSGDNAQGESFESSEKIRRDLESLVRTVTYLSSNSVPYIDTNGLDSSSIFFTLPSNLLYITLEQVEWNDASIPCYNGKRITVVPVTQDEYAEVKNNPFRGPSKYKVLRADCGNNTVELISNYTISKYYIRYIEKPTPIILVKLPNDITIEGINEQTECTLNSDLHYKILENAVNLALMSKGALAKS